MVHSCELVPCSPLSREALVLLEEVPQCLILIDCWPVNPKASSSHPNDLDHLVIHGEDGDTTPDALRLAFSLRD
jgi:hypothetical protein